MAYDTVFDAVRDCHDAAWPWWVQFLALVGLILRMFYLRSKINNVFPHLKRWDRPQSISTWLGLIFTSVVVFQMLFDAFGDFNDCGPAVSALQRGLFSVAEGSVTGFDPHYAGVIEKGESFVVSGKRFFISRYNHVGGPFHKVSQLGGPIRNGLNVRVYYTGDKILRLDVENRARKGANKGLGGQGAASA